MTTASAINNTPSIAPLPMPSLFKPISRRLKNPYDNRARCVMVDRAYWLGRREFPLIQARQLNTDKDNQGNHAWLTGLNFSERGGM